MPRRKGKPQEHFGQIRTATLPPCRKRRGRALIVEGGGMRGAFAGGVLAAMNRWQPSRGFDIVVGVSAGSCSAAYYVTEDPNDLESTLRNLNVWRYELSTGQFLSTRRLIGKKTVMDQSYLVDHLFGSQYPLKRERLNRKRTTPLYVVVSNLRTGEPEYIRATADNALPLLKAATALPIATKGRSELGDQLYTDGAVTDPIPIEAVIQAGYRDITVVLNHPRSYISGRTGRLLSFLSFPYNRTMARFVHREHHLKYNRAKELINHPPRGVRVRIVDPPMSLPMKIVTTNEQILNQVVDLGMEAGRKAFEMAREEKRRFRRWLSSLFKKKMRG
ncbi:MAG: patatin family protein [Leptospiraceae bacterium]|nr:patatin family protein [Leptospiraceae bacterium]